MKNGKRWGEDRVRRDAIRQRKQRMAKKRRRKKKGDKGRTLTDGKGVLLKILVQFIPLTQRVLFSHSLAN